LWCAGLVTVAACRHEPRPGTVDDEAKRAGLRAEQLLVPTEDYFRQMDVNVVNGGPVAPLSQAEIEGRNMWLVWTGGNDRLWDRLTVDSIGTFDLLKTVSSHPAAAYPDPYAKPGTSPKYLYGYGRKNRFAYLGLINEPCF